MVMYPFVMTAAIYVFEDDPSPYVYTTFWEAET